MSTIEKFVSPFIPQQFPSFYKEEGPNFIAFVKAYYEWLESSGQALQRSRSLLEYSDIDTTEQEFLKYFRNTYLHSLPESIIADKRLLVKHIVDLYRAKGTPRAYELLFRLIFDEDIELYIPSDFIFKPSDGEWTVPRYIEVSDSDYLEELIGKQIYNSSRNATAVVESVNQKVVNGKLFHVLTLSSVKGRFKYGEKILCASIPEITLQNAPNVIGSLTAIAIENGGLGFDVGDIVDVSGSGTGGKARIAAVRDENGKVSFNLENGGSGYSLDATITVATTLNLIVNNPTGTFANGDVITSSNTSANGTLTFSNSSLLQLINFSSNLIFNTGDTVTNGNGASATVTSVVGGGGTGATFSIGGLVNKEVLLLNTDFISNYLNANLSVTWAFPKNPVANLNSTIGDTLSFTTLEVGTISFLSRISPGTGYSAPPYISVTEPIVASQKLNDGFGGIKGLNALVTSEVANSQGIVTAVEVINSGLGFDPGTKVFLSSPDNQGVVVTGSSVVDTDGTGEGFWKNNQGFLSDIMNIQDSYYYQDFSYEILVNRMLSVYEKIVRDLVHPTGIALFGRFRLKNQNLGVSSEPKFFDLDAGAAALPTPTDLITLSSLNKIQLNRNSSATYVRSADNQFVEFGFNEARFDPALGLLIEGESTNRCNNPRAEYSTLPTFPTATLPVNWGTIPTGIPNRDIVGYQTINGINCILLRLSGVPTVSGTSQIWAVGGLTDSGVTIGTVVTSSVFVALVGGTLRNIGGFELRTENAPGSTSFNLTSTLTRISNIRTLTGTSAFTALRWAFTNTTDPVDITIAIGCPDRKFSSFLSSPVLPPVGTRAVSTRLTEQLTASLSSLGVSTSGLSTMVGTYTLYQLGSGGFLPNLMEINNGSLNDRVWVYNSAGTIVMARSTGGVTTTVTLGSGIVADTPFRVAISNAGNGRIAGSLNGGALQTLAGAPTTYTTMRVGSGFGGDQPMFGYQRGFSYLDYAVDDTRLQQLSTLT